MWEGVSDQFCWEKINGGVGWVTYTTVVIILILIWQLTTTYTIFAKFRFPLRFLFSRSEAAPPHFLRQSNYSVGSSSSLSPIRFVFLPLFMYDVFCLVIFLYFTYFHGWMEDLLRIRQKEQKTEENVINETPD